MAGIVGDDPWVPFFAVRHPVARPRSAAGCRLTISHLANGKYMVIR
jgi:hypothetical protein